MMKNLLCVLILLLALTPKILANEASLYDHFVWAKSGLNMRSGPGTDHEIIEKLNFGDSVIILDKTSISYNVAGIKEVKTTQHYSTRFVRRDPYIIYGNWVEILSATGKVGYVIDQFLLKSQPYKSDHFCLKEIARDTITKNINGWKSSYVRKTYTDDIISGNHLNDKYYEETFIFPELNIQEVFVILTSKETFISKGKILQNWKEELLISDGMCSIRIVQKNGYVLAVLNCSC